MIAPIIGPESFESKKVIKIVPFKGVPQGSIIGPILCNVVLDGLETAIDNECINHPYYQLNPQQINFATSKVGMSEVNKERETNINCLRFADDIFIFGSADRNIMKRIETTLREFLKSRGLSIKDSKDNIKVFCPGSHFEYLGFQFVFPDYKNSMINRGKFTKKINDINTLASYRFSSYHRSNPYLCIAKKKFINIKYNLAKLFSRGLASMDLKAIIYKINSYIRGVCNYYSISTAARRQLKYIDEVIHRKINKRLKQKFKSMPKVGAFIKKNILVGGRIACETATLLKVSDIKPYGGANIF